MTNREIIEKYFEYANAGDWNAWSDLFSEDCIYDEQQAGHIEGRETLRSIVLGFPKSFKSFTNTPRYIFVSGNQGAAVAHISARALKYPDEPIEAEAMNYFQFKNGEIVYAENFHDTKPFAPFQRQLSEGS